MKMVNGCKRSVYNVSARWTLKTDKFTLFMNVSSTVYAVKTNKQIVNIADENLTDYSFLCRYHYTISKNYLKRRYRIRHWIPMFIDLNYFIDNDQSYWIKKWYPGPFRFKTYHFLRDCIICKLKLFGDQMLVREKISFAKSFKFRNFFLSHPENMFFKFKKSNIWKKISENKTKFFVNFFSNLSLSVTVILSYCPIDSSPAIFRGI